MIVDRELVARLESSAARVSVATVEAFVARDAGDPARAVAFGSGALVALGPGRYVNRAVGVTLDDIDDAGLDEIEAFFAAAGVPPSIEVASWCPPRLLDRLVGGATSPPGSATSTRCRWTRRCRRRAPTSACVEVIDASLEEWLALLRVANEIDQPRAVEGQRRVRPRRPPGLRSERLHRRSRRRRRSAAGRWSVTTASGGSAAPARCRATGTTACRRRCCATAWRSPPATAATSSPRRRRRRATRRATCPASGSRWCSAQVVMTKPDR